MGASVYSPLVYQAMPDVILARANSLIGGAIGDPRSAAWYWNDFWGTVQGNAIPPDWRSIVVGTGVGSYALLDEAGGVHQLSTGATAASSLSHVTDSPFIRAVGSTPWYAAARKKVTTGITAQTMEYAGVFDLSATKTIACGVFGANNIVNFVCQYDGNEAGTFIDLGVAIDTNYHIFEMWGGDGKIHCAIDFGPDKGGAVMGAAPAGSCGFTRMIKNGGDAVARSVRGDWVAMFAKRT